MKRKGVKKLLSVALAFSLVAGTIPDAAFAQDETEEATAVETESTEEVTSETETEMETATETTAIETQPETEIVTEMETASVTEAELTETDEAFQETESEQTQEAETQSETEAETETEAAAAALCDHGNTTDSCVICEVEALIDELPTADEISEMDTDGQNEVYAQASDIKEALLIHII